MRKLTNMLLLALALLAVVACTPFGGGGDSDENNAPVPALNAGENAATASRRKRVTINRRVMTDAVPYPYNWGMSWLKPPDNRPDRAG